jgi:hypothetical protein
MNCTWPRLTLLQGEIPSICLVNSTIRSAGFKPGIAMVPCSFMILKEYKYRSAGGSLARYMEIVHGGRDPRFCETCASVVL